MSILHPLSKHYNTQENYNILKNWSDTHEKLNKKAIDIKIDKKKLEKELEKIIDKAMKEIIRKSNK